MPENTQRVSVGGFSFENKDEAEQLSAKFNMRGLRTLVLTGDNSQRRSYFEA